ncbi:unnamed protein product [Protopolystoma xenopodis]|uniref:Uncharacterized protein n=1 Tax=Protopolystoma xenopodis TaxID=117903 RepID=A0A448WVI4_9PLAT|nr:unnamed protein product [Protopolystoma xenopodis]
MFELETVKRRLEFRRRLLPQARPTELVAFYVVEDVIIHKQTVEKLEPKSPCAKSHLEAGNHDGCDSLWSRLRMALETPITPRSDRRFDPSQLRMPL